MDKSARICVGMIGEPHGVRGLVRLRSFTEDPYAIVDYKPLTDEVGDRVFKVTIKNVMKDHFVAAVSGVESREDAVELRGTKLFIDRKILPKTKSHEYYQADLIGLAAHDGSGKDYGRIMNVHDYGAGPFLEIGRSRKDSFMIPFKDPFVPEVNFKEGRVVIAPPEGWLDKDKEPEIDDED